MMLLTPSMRSWRMSVDFDFAAVEAVEEDLPAFGFGEVLGDAGPDELPGGVCHVAADDEAFGSRLFEPLAEKVSVKIGPGVSY